jgi:hypothetical protein
MRRIGPARSTLDNELEETGFTVLTVKLNMSAANGAGEERAWRPRKILLKRKGSAYGVFEEGRAISSHAVYVKSSKRSPGDSE